jgi:Spy/CpxP family protein refolding chaperone
MNSSHHEASRETSPRNNRSKKWTIVAVLVAASIAASLPPAVAQPQGYGPGMMGGYGYGGYGMGPGMMGGYGPGPGYSGMGPGMMYGYGGYGMGPGMMYGWGPGYGTGAGLNLTDEQRRKISKIQQDLRSKQWGLMGKIQDEYSRRADAADDATASKADDQIVALQQQMLANATAARKQMDAVLTQEQRQQLRRDGY